jgi:hypothetical protein
MRHFKAKITMDIQNSRFILFIKHPVSANLHFILFPYKSICTFYPLPPLCTIVDCENGETNDHLVHPSSALTWGEKELQFDKGTLYIEPEFHELVEVPKGRIRIFLAGFTDYFAAQNIVEGIAAKPQTLLECIGLSPVEMLLLQKAYRVIMGG